MAEEIHTSDIPSSSSTLNPSLRNICHVCHKQFSQYTCPRCNSRYCSLHCYKSHSTSCTESFMRENVVGELQQMQSDDSTKRKMLDILKRFHGEEEMKDLDEDEDEDEDDPTLPEEIIQKALAGSDLDNLKEDSGPLWGGSDDELEDTSDLDREWQKRHDQFHTIGYRDGVIAGKEASAQEGFNIGFKQSTFAGYDWGLVRGVSSVLACLPNDLKEKLVRSEENRNKFQSLYESVHSLSTTDALSLFNDDFIAGSTAEECAKVDALTQVIGLSKQNFDCGRLGKYYGELQALLPESPSLNIHLREDQ